MKLKGRMKLLSYGAFWFFLLLTFLAGDYKPDSEITRKFIPYYVIFSFAATCLIYFMESQYNLPSDKSIFADYDFEIKTMRSFFMFLAFSLVSLPFFLLFDMKNILENVNFVLLGLGLIAICVFLFLSLFSFFSTGSSLEQMLTKALELDTEGVRKKRAYMLTGLIFGFAALWVLVQI